MKKGKTIIIIILVIIGVLIIDTAQALIFDNSPLFKIRDYYNGGTLYYKDKGILTDTYCGINGQKDTVIKGFSYSLSNTDMDLYEIVDMTKNNQEISVDTALEEIYEDEKYIYYLPTMKSQYIVVRFRGGREYKIIPALQNGYVNIGDLDKFDIDYIKQEK